MVDSTNYLDVYGIALNEVFGSLWLLLIVGSLLIIYGCLKLNLPMQASFMLVPLFWLVVAAASFNLLVYILPVLAGAAFFGFLYSRVMRRG